MVGTVQANEEYMHYFRWTMSINLIRAEDLAFLINAAYSILGNHTGVNRAIEELGFPKPELISTPIRSFAQTADSPYLKLNDGQDSMRGIGTRAAEMHDIGCPSFPGY